MKYLFIACICLFVMPVFAQFVYDYQVLDSLDVTPTPEPQYKVTSVNLEGDFHELVISVGFPDRPATLNYPVIVNNSTYPLLGFFEDGTLLKDAVTSNGGSLPINEWFEPAFDKYYNTLSGGIYNVDFDFLKPANGRYITNHSMAYFIQQNGGSSNNVVVNEYQIILNDIAEVIFNDNPNAFDDIDLLHFTFEGLPADEFAVDYGGTVRYGVTLTGPQGQIYYSNKPITIQIATGAIIHERLHIIGAISGSPNGFDGFPDRGFDRYVSAKHYNMFFAQDIMYHNAPFHHQFSLYGLPPMLSHDLIFLGWIKPEEILEIDESNFSNYSLLKLSDVNYPLTLQQLSDGRKRIIKVMIKRDFSQELDEYFLIEYHNATEFDKAFGNYDEYQTNGYNKGVLVWHIKERTNLIDVFSDNYIDLEVAVPYNGWNDNPIPNTPFPRDYYRPPNLFGMTYWNNTYSEDYDYIDDDFMYEIVPDQWIFEYPPDGGRHIWEITVPPPHPWYPPDPTVFIRMQSMRSDFFTDENIKGYVTNKLSDATRPSTKTWGDFPTGAASEKTHIAIKNITRQSSYMSLEVKYNYWEGNVTANSTMSGEVIIGDGLTVDEGVTLTIAPNTVINSEFGEPIYVNGKLLIEANLIISTDIIIQSNGEVEVLPGANLAIQNDKSLIIKGELLSEGLSSNRIIYSFTSGSSGIKFKAGSSGSISYTDINGGNSGITMIEAAANIRFTTISNCNLGFI